MLKRQAFGHLVSLATLISLTGCGSPTAVVSVEYGTVTITSAQDSAQVTFNIVCEEYAGRNEANVCPEDAGSDNPVCYEVYWMPTHYEGERLTDEGGTTNIEQGSVSPYLGKFNVDLNAALLSAKACRTFSQTPQTLTYEVSFDAPAPATAVELIIMELPPNDSQQRAPSDRLYVYPLPQPAQ